MDTNKKISSSHCLYLFKQVLHPYICSSSLIWYLFIFQDKQSFHVARNCKITHDSWWEVMTRAKLIAAPPTYPVYVCVCVCACARAHGGARVYVILLSLALHAVQPTRSNPVLTTVSWAAVTDVKSHYPNAAISLTRSWVNEFVEMCDPFLIRWFLMHWWERGREMWVCQFSRNGTSSAATCRACCVAKRLCLMGLTPRLDFHGGTFFQVIR